MSNKVKLPVRSPLPALLLSVALSACATETIKAPATPSSHVNDERDQIERLLINAKIEQDTLMTALDSIGKAIDRPNMKGEVEEKCGSVISIAGIPSKNDSGIVKLGPWIRSMPVYQNPLEEELERLEAKNRCLSRALWRGIEELREIMQERIERMNQVPKLLLPNSISEQ